MAATTAAARSASPARRAPARKPAPPRKRPAPRRRRSQQTPVVGFVPVAVGRTAGAVGGLADSGIFVWLTRGRLWIGLLGGLLVGIVAINVIALSFTANSSKAAREADAVKLENSTLSAEVATRLSNEKVQSAATTLGLEVPPPGSIQYLKPSDNDAATAARRLRDGQLTQSDYVAPATTDTAAATVAPPATTTPTVPATEPPVTETAAPPVTEAATTDPAAAVTDATATSPVATTTPVAPPAGGGVGAP